MSKYRFPSFRTTALWSVVVTCFLIAFAPASQGQSLPYVEDFETDGAGTRYTASSTFNNSLNDHFQRTDGSDIENVTGPYTGFGGTFFFAGEDLDDAADGLAEKTLTLQEIDVSSSSATVFTGRFAAGCSEGPVLSCYDVDDFLAVEYSTDGGTTFQRGLLFSYVDAGDDFNEPLALDENQDGNGEGTVLTPAMQTFSFDLPSSASTVIVRIVANINGGAEEIAFDDLTIQEAPDPSSIAVSQNGTSISNGATFAFSPTVVGTPISRSFTIANTSTDSDLSVSNIQNSNSDFFSITNTSFASTPVTIAPGASETFTLERGATSEGRRTTTITIDSDAANVASFGFTVASRVVEKRISRVVPESAVPGQDVVVRGTGLGQVSTLTVGGAAATVTSTAPDGTSLTATVPSGVTGPSIVEATYTDATTSRTPDPLTVVTGGSGFFDASGVSLQGLEFASGDWGDYDGDGDLDLVLNGVDNNGTNVSTLLENQGGTFVGITLSTNLTISGTGVDGDTEWVDFNGDGAMDLFLMGRRSGGLPGTSLIVGSAGSGGGVFNVDSELSLQGLDNGSGDWGDVDGDGLPELLLTGEDSDNVPSTVVYTFDVGGPQPSAIQVDLGLPDVTGGVGKWGDYDGDGDLDILLTGETAGAAVYENDEENGNGFVARTTGLPTSPIQSGDWGDYDGDGDLDLVLVGGESNGAASADVYRNEGDGTFTAIGAGLQGVERSTADWVDYDGDGDPDLVLTGKEASTGEILPSLYENQGSGTFVRSFRLDFDTLDGDVLPGDYDNDGDVDLLVSGGLSTNLYENTAPPVLSVTQGGSAVTDGGIVDVGSTLVSTDATVTLTLENTGSQTDLRVSDIAIDNTDAFNASPSSALPLTLAPGETTTLAVTLSGATVGTFQTGITVTSNDLDSPFALTVEGRVAPPVLYVSQDGSDANDGRSWNTAFRTVQQALSTVRPGDPTEIWVAEGVYYPDNGPGQTADARTSTFALVDGVDVYGGFASGEASRDLRDAQLNPTVLSGDVDENDTDPDGDGIVLRPLDVTGSNSFHVVTAQDVSTEVRLDGFVITGGVADGSGTDGNGGGLFVSNAPFAGSSLVLAGNQGASSAAGFFTASPARLQNVVVVSNTATSGNVLEAEGASLSVTTSLMAGNTAGSVVVFANGAPLTLNASTITRHDVPAVESINASIGVQNSILWQNGAGAQLIPGDSDSSVALENVILDGGTADGVDVTNGFIAAATNVQDADPLFADADGADGTPGTLDDNFRLLETSPGVAAGNDLLLPVDALDADRDGDTAEAYPIDLDGEARVQDGSLDLGAYEGGEVVSAPTLSLTRDGQAVGEGSTEDLGNSPQGTNLRETFTIENTDADSDLSVSSITAGNLDFYRIEEITLPITLAPGATATFDVVLDGGIATTETSFVTLESNASGSPFAFQVSGTITAPDEAPTITGLTDVTVDEDTDAGPVVFTVGDAESAEEDLSITAASGNPDLIPDANLSLSTADADGNVSITATPLPDSSGTAEITVTVSDGTTPVAASFLVTVAPVNDAPEVSSVSDQTIAEDEAVSALPFTVSDVDTPLSNLSVTASSSNPDLLPDANLTLGGNGTGRTISATPLPDSNGTATVTLTVDDGAASVTTTFGITVNPVNDAPRLSTIPDQTVAEDGSLGPVAFTVEDVETPAGDLVVTASSDAPSVVPDANLTVGGSGTDRTISASPLPDSTGTATITIAVDDGAETVTTQFALTVSPQPDPPQAVINPATDVTASTARLTGRVNPQGGETTAEFVLTPMSDPETSIRVPADENPVTGTSEQPVQASVGGLDLDTEYSARLVATNPAGSSQSETISFVTVNPLTIAPSDSVAFEAIGVGSTSLKRVEVQNSGSGDLDVTELSITGTDAAVFSVVARPSLPVTLAPDETVAFDVEYAPEAMGDALSATLRIVSARETETLPLSGEAVATPSAPLGRIAVRNTTERTVLVPNPLDRAVTLRDVNVGGEDASTLTVTSDTSGVTVEPGSAVTVDLLVTPFDSAPFSAVVDVITDRGTIRTDLSGVGVGIQAKAGEAGEPLDPPLVGTPVPVTIEVPDAFTPDELTLFFRPAGAPEYRSRTVTITPSATQRKSKVTVPAVIPGRAVTETGVQYYVQATEATDNRTLTVTFPATTPEAAPMAIPTRIPVFSARGAVQAERYRMYSIPVQLDSSAVSLLERPVNFGPYDPTVWRAFRYPPSLDRRRDEGLSVDDVRLQEFPDIDSLDVPGAAFWHVGAEADTLRALDAVSTDPGTPQTIRLQPGWNQIGSPFAFAVDWATILDASRDGRSDAENAALDALSEPVFWDGTTYRYGRQTLLPWRGYFVYNPTPGQVVRLTVPPEGVQELATTDASQAASSTPSTVLSTAAARLPGAKKMTGSETYRVNLRATLRSEALGRTLVDAQNWIGLVPGASENRGPEDVAEAPPVGEYVRLSVIPESTPYETLAGSFKPASDRGQYWDVQVAARVQEPFETRKTISVQLLEDGRLPDGFNLYVIDRDERRMRPVDDNRFEVVLGSEQRVRRFRVIAGTKSFAEQNSDGVAIGVFENKLLGNFPNPVTRETRIAYQLEKQADVSISVYDLLGRRIADLVEGETKDAGPHEVVWTGTSASGRPVASGVYFYRIRAGDFTDTGKMTIVR